MITRLFWRKFINHWYNSLQLEEISPFFEKEIVYGVLNNRLFVFFNPQPLNPYWKMLCLQ